jgi:hypothetical protein
MFSLFGRKMRFRSRRMGREWAGAPSASRRQRKAVNVALDLVDRAPWCASEPGLDDEPSPWLDATPPPRAAQRPSFVSRMRSSLDFTYKPEPLPRPRRAAWPVRLPISPSVPVPIAAPLVLAPRVALRRTPAPAVRMNDHVRFSRIAVAFASMPANVAAADNGRRRARSG